MPGSPRRIDNSSVGNNARGVVRGHITSSQRAAQERIESKKKKESESQLAQRRADEEKTAAVALIMAKKAEDLRLKTEERVAKYKLDKLYYSKISICEKYKTLYNFRLCIYTIEPKIESDSYLKSARSRKE